MVFEYVVVHCVVIQPLANVGGSFTQPKGSIPTGGAVACFAQIVT
jgi:hypothetical protein